MIKSIQFTSFNGELNIPPSKSEAQRSLLCAALADGESTIHNVEQIDRGYQNIDDRLNAIGADIQRID